MRIIGANVGSTYKGMTLNDGGLCLIEDGDVTIVAEERVSRRKYDGGFKQSLKRCLERKKLSIDDIDLFVLSSCCEKTRKVSELYEIDLPKDRTVFISSHHLSHAYSAYYTAPFEDDAIVMVLDNEGNIVKDVGGEEYFDNWLEHMSYYVASKEKGIVPLEVDEVAPNEIGVGDAYRYFTHYIGFPSYVYAGKTMGLAPYGQRETFENVKIFELIDGHIKCHIPQNYKEPKNALAEFFKNKYGIILDKPRSPIDEITQQHMDLAWLIQDQLEKVVIQKVEYLIKKTGIKKLCFAGGVGLNSVLNGKLLTTTSIEDIYIPPAAGDTGQCLGNALYGYYSILGKKNRIQFTSAYLGFSYSEKEIINAISNYSKEINMKFFERQDEANRCAAALLSQGYIVARFMGRSEYGPRALGNRSILMDPRHGENKDILNRQVKYRESFRPFAPSVLNKYKETYFEMDFESPYMLLVAKVNKPNDIPAVTHTDRTARVQTVKRTDNPDYYDLINEFYKLTGIPVLLNTSFNLSGQPIVEKPEDAISCLCESNIDYLLINNIIVMKKNSKKELEEALLEYIQ